MVQPLSSSESHELLEHLFRRESGKMIAVLTRMLGVANLATVEDIVQEVLLRALNQWPFAQPPPNPSAWLMRSAKNLALDHLRRQRFLQWVEPSVTYHLTDTLQTSDSPDDVTLESEIADDQLRMMFTCCHPGLPKESQIALTLRTLCGFSVTEIARAFVTAEPTIAKRLVRARQWAREEGIAFEVPSGDELEERLSAVLNVLYLLFSEGYNSTSGDDLIRRDLCEEAIHLTTKLVEHRVGDQPKTHALLALMYFHSARFDSRIDSHGNLQLLSEQDRSKWDARLIERGLDHLRRSAAGDVISEYHIEAGIMACHLTARDFESTDWQQILGLYDLLSLLNDSPIIALNRTVALAKIEGAEAGLAAVGAIANSEKLDRYYLYHAIRAEFHSQLGEDAAAISAYERALSLSPSPNERQFLETKLKKLRAI